MTKREWLEIRITLPETLQEETGIFYGVERPGGCAGRRRGISRYDGLIRTYFPAGEFTADNRRDLLQYLDRLVSLGYRIGELQQRLIEEEDWERTWQVHFKSRRLTGRFVVRPPWEEYTPVGNDVVLTIYPGGMAFGTGRHPSTWLCLRALEEVARTRRTT